MPKVTISAQAEAAIRARATGDLEELPANANGSYTISIAHETIARFREHAFPGESLSDTILRVVTCARRATN